MKEVIVYKKLLFSRYPWDSKSTPLKEATISLSHILELKPFLSCYSKTLKSTSFLLVNPTLLLDLFSNSS